MRRNPSAVRFASLTTLPVASFRQSDGDDQSSVAVSSPQTAASYLSKEASQRPALRTIMPSLDGVDAHRQNRICQGEAQRLSERTYTASSDRAASPSSVGGRPAAAAARTSTAQRSSTAAASGRQGRRRLVRPDLRRKQLEPGSQGSSPLIRVRPTPARMPKSAVRALGRRRPRPLACRTAAASPVGA